MNNPFGYGGQQMPQQGFAPNVGPGWLQQQRGGMPPPQMPMSSAAQPTAPSAGGAPGFALPPNMGSPGGGMPGQGSSGLNPAAVGAMLGSGDDATEQGMIDHQRKMADMMRAGAEQQLQGKQVGKQYFAPGWGNALANVAMQGAGAYGDADANARAKTLGGNQRKAAGDWFSALTGKAMPEQAASSGGGGLGFGQWLGGMFGGGGGGG
jgi:hypothetical protein